MAISDHPDFRALDTFFRIIEEGVAGLVDREHYFETLAEDVVFDYIITVPGYPRRVQGRQAVVVLEPVSERRSVRLRVETSDTCVRLLEVQMSLVEVPDELWEVVQPLIPVVRRRFRHPGRKRLDDRQALNGILYVLHTGIAWHDLPLEFGYGSGVTCWRRLREWQQAGVWERLHHELLERLHQAGEIDWSRAIADSSHIRALLGGSKRGHPQSIAGAWAQSTTC